MAAPVSMLVFAAFGFGAMADDKTPPVIPYSAVKESANCPPENEDCKIVCKKLPPRTGSRLGGHTECRTKRWWDDRMHEDQNTILKLQENSYKQTGGYGG
jgi:hypothetical protein